MKFHLTLTGPDVFEILRQHIASQFRLPITQEHILHMSCDVPAIEFEFDTDVEKRKEIERRKLQALREGLVTTP